MGDEKHFNAAGTHVLVFNPETEARWECPADYLKVALVRGWELAEPEDEDALDVTPAPAPKPRARKSSKSGD